VRRASDRDDGCKVVVVEEPLHMEAADLVARVSYNRDGDMVGLWFLPSGQALAGEERQ